MSEPTASATIDQPSAPAAPAPPSAPAPEGRSTALSTLTDTEREEWSVKGKLPERLTDWKKPADTPEPAAAPTGDDAPALDAQNRPILGADNKPLSKRAAEAERRTREAVERATAGALARAEAAERRAAELEARINGTPPPAKPQEQPAQPAEDKEPTIEDFPIDQFLDKADPYGAQQIALARALNKYDRQQEAKAAAADTETRTAHTRAIEGVLKTVSTYQERETAFKAGVPDYDTKTLPIRQQLNPTSPLAAALLDSPVAPQLVLHLAEHPADFERIGVLGSTNLPAALRELGKLEAKYDTAASAAPAQPAASPKTVSDAPAIGTTLGSQPAAAANASHAALARKDFRAFDELETSKELERFRGRRST